jgi:hypothetical protein
MCNTRNNNEEPRRTYCSRCEEVAIGVHDNLCKDCCEDIDAEWKAQRAEEDWKQQEEEGGSSPSPCARCGLHHGDLIDEELVTIDPNSGLCLYCEAQAATWNEPEPEVTATGYEDDYLFDPPVDEDW